MNCLPFAMKILRIGTIPHHPYPRCERTAVVELPHYQHNIGKTPFSCTRRKVELIREKLIYNLDKNRIKVPSGC